ncbi:MAG: phosphohistidine phosphatase SixA [candidate division Zixibacteria bacterium]|nr:phosphohistidine phosphatase SixA [candidate division Zixibacteria bacterium]
MYVYLVQHALAKEKHEDPNRSLSDQGRTDITKMTHFVAEHLTIDVNTIVHSGKTRAEETAGVLAEKLNPAGGVRTEGGLAPLDDPAIWAKRLESAAEDIMLVGHLPHLSKLAARLIWGDDSRTVVSFRNAGIVCLGRDDFTDWSVQWALFPDMLK